MANVTVAAALASLRHGKKVLPCAACRRVKKGGSGVQGLDIYGIMHDGEEKERAKPSIFNV